MESVLGALSQEIIMHSHAEEAVLYPFIEKRMGQEGKEFSEVRGNLLSSAVECPCLRLAWAVGCILLGGQAASCCISSPRHKDWLNVMCMIFIQIQSPGLQHSLKEHKKLETELMEALHKRKASKHGGWRDGGPASGRQSASSCMCMRGHRMDQLAAWQERRAWHPVGS
jgi:hypothetical protein